MAKRIREKAAARQESADKRPRAVAKYVRISPDKVRIVLDVIRGVGYTEAVAILKSTRKAACEPLLKVLESAAANAENNLNMSKGELYVAECYANAGPILKRVMPRAKGSASRINKRTSHITVILDTKTEER
ncbi:MAG TPA: 50S ribosomal protein L22 [Candidatus Ornithoclostridium faecigallinarum]|nr:50S ribosomal protein L22 [Candidatus Ornithoclostridium faecigallinarum]